MKPHPSLILVLPAMACLATPAVAAPADPAPADQTPGAQALALTAGQMALNGYWHGARRGPPPGAGGGPPGGPGGPGSPGGPGRGPPPGGADGIGQAASKVAMPWVQAAQAKFRAGEAAGQQGRTPNNLCLPSAIPGTGVPGGPAYGVEILVEPKQVTLLYEENRTMRIVHIGAQHPADLKPSWLGHSIGRWEGDTLVVDTIGFNDQNMLGDGIPVTHALHVVQRLRVVNGRLEDQAGFEDPGAFMAGFSAVSRFDHGEAFQEYICAENNNEGGVPTSTGKPTAYVLPVAATSARTVQAAR